MKKCIFDGEKKHRVNSNDTSINHLKINIYENPSYQRLASWARTLWL